VRGESRTVQLSPEDQETVLRLRTNMENTLNRYHAVLRSISEAAGVRVPEGRAILSVLPEGNLRVDW
jgi:hypothetical protein